MAKKIQELKVPASNEEVFETNTAALKLQNKMALDRLAILNETVLQVVEGMNNLKQAYFTMDSKIDTVLARLDSMGTVVAKSAPTFKPVPLPSQQPANATPPQQTAVQAPPTVGGAGQTTPFTKKPAATRLNLDGTIERGIAPPTNSKGNTNVFEPITVQTLEFTPNAIKVVFEGSWNVERNTNEVWLAKKLISPESTIRRLQAMQPLMVVNWWIGKNSR